MLISSSAETNQGEPSIEARPLRNSARIQNRFGNYGIDIIENKSGIRVSNLYSIHDGVKTNRTFAVVAYPDCIEEAFKQEHEAIINGQSIGVVFEQNGWEIDKLHQYFGEIELPSDMSGTHSVFDRIDTHKPAIHIYSLMVKKDDCEFEYAFIAEVHHPDFQKLEDLKAIYGQTPDNPMIASQRVNDFLDIVKTRIQGL